ncbi:P27 family phage terminase small subunit [Paraburkholderia susongensis]|uniref:Phage terminase, small subunit n=1 Tax=Paraburkholderia susongensis TaxID=1515439 RepID=A0A1X7I581_9BURK|nr:P27 family phage terminase small subunit [Paraburkholderia susongensis]SMG09622.1 Phage terminase, small subunit [Paraburkholderia susongensis]
MASQFPPVGINFDELEPVDPAAAENNALPLPPGVQLTSRERAVWDYIVARLTEEGLAHRTAGLAITVIARTYIAWVDAGIELEKVKEKHNGSYFIRTPKGYEQPHQAYYTQRNLKQELLRWLPECCLTLPSRAAVMVKKPDDQQDDLFDDLVGHGAQHPGSLRN